MTTPQDQGALCTNCGTTAVECQHIFRAAPDDKKKWCCLPCQENGPKALHQKERVDG